MARTSTETAEAPKVKKTLLARDTAFEVLKKARKPLPLKEIVSQIHANNDPVIAGLNKSTIAVQVAAEAALPDGRFVKTDRSVYATRAVAEKLASGDGEQPAESTETQS